MSSHFCHIAKFDRCVLLLPCACGQGTACTNADVHSGKQQWRLHAAVGLLHSAKTYLDAEQMIEGFNGVPIEVHLLRAMCEAPSRHVLHKKAAHPARQHSNSPTNLSSLLSMKKQQKQVIKMCRKQLR